MSISTTIDNEGMRDWLGLTTSDPPSNSVITKHITWSLVPIERELESSDSDVIDYAVLLRAGSRILKVLAQRAVKNGYIKFNGAGLDVTKSPGEILELAQTMRDDYEQFCSLMVNEVTTTKFLSGLSSGAVEDIRDIYQGVNNCWDYQNSYHPSMNRQNL